MLSPPGRRCPAMASAPVVVGRHVLAPVGNTQVVCGLVCMVDRLLAAFYPALDEFTGAHALQAGLDLFSFGSPLERARAETAIGHDPAILQHGPFALMTAGTRRIRPFPDPQRPLPLALLPQT